MNWETLAAPPAPLSEEQRRLWSMLYGIGTNKVANLFEPLVDKVDAEYFGSLSAPENPLDRRVTA